MVKDTKRYNCLCIYFKHIVLIHTCDLNDLHMTFYNQLIQKSKGFANILVKNTEKRNYTLVFAHTTPNNI